MARILAVIPARGGSKRLPRKNLRPLRGRPLLQWSVSFAIKTGLCEAVVISSDDPEIVECGKAAGATSFGLRPQELSGDHATSVDVALHELQNAEEKYGAFDYLALLQPTTPFRKQQRMQDALDLLEAHPDALSVVGVSAVSAMPYHMFTMDTESRVKPLFPDHLQMRTQDLPKTVEVNGSLYLVRTPALKKYRSVYFGTSRAVLCDDPREMVDIDTIDDFAAAETLLKGEQA